MKTKKNIEDIAIDELEKSFIEDYYTWMLGTAGNANATAFNRINTLKWLMYIAQEKGWLRVHPFTSFECKPEYKKRSFLTEEELQRIIHVDLKYKRQRAMRDMFLFMCFTGLAYADLKAITYDNIHTDSDGGTWLMGNRIKTGVAYVVKLLPIAVELIEKYRGVDERRIPRLCFPRRRIQHDVPQPQNHRQEVRLPYRNHPAYRTSYICSSGHSQRDAVGNPAKGIRA